MKSSPSQPINADFRGLAFFFDATENYHNSVKVSDPKYSPWAREQLRQQLKQIWESGVFPEALITGKATVSFKSGDSEKYPRHRVLVMFIAEHKIFVTILMRRVGDEYSWFLRW